MVKTKCLIWITASIILASLSHAETTSLLYTKENSTNNAFFFKERSFNEKYADVFFSGIEDKEEGFQAPLLYTKSHGMIAPTGQNGCSEAINQADGSKEANIKVGNYYCLLTRDQKDYVKIKVIGLAEDWSSVTIDWQIIGQEQTREKPGYKSKNPPPQTAKDNRFWIYLIANSIILTLIITTIIEIRKHS